MTPIESKIIAWADARNLISGTTTHHQALKLVEEVGELASAILHNDREKTVDGIGDCYVVLCNLSAKIGLSLDDCARAAYEEIKDRKGKMIDGTFVKK